MSEKRAANPQTSTWLTYESKNSKKEKANAETKEKLLIFLIPGNPGLVGYYAAFLEHLHSVLDSALNSGRAEGKPEVEVKVCGRSLRGFEVDGSLISSPSPSSSPGPGAGDVGKEDGKEDQGKWPQPLDLKTQILATEDAVFRTARRFCRDHLSPEEREGSGGGDVAQPEQEKSVKIVLIGHSVGAYIALEVLKRQRERFCAGSTSPNGDLNGQIAVEKEGEQGEEGGEKRQADEARIVGVVGLTPTVVDIARSDSGRKVASLLRISFLPALLNFLATCLTWFIPLSIFSRIVAKVLKFTPVAAETTAAFVKSRHVIRNSLYLAGTEMAQITHDAWTDEIWGAATPSPSKYPRAKLRFLFADKDHWVANKTRDDLIKRRGFETRVEGSDLVEGNENADSGKLRSKEDWKPRMEIQNGLRHAFCVHQSEAVAEKVARYVQEMVADDRGA